MKGRRKLLTDKWQKKAAIEADARETLRRRSATSGRFLDRALDNGREFEPLGPLAG